MSKHDRVRLLEMPDSSYVAPSAIKNVARFGKVGIGIMNEYGETLAYIPTRDADVQQRVLNALRPIVTGDVHWKQPDWSEVLKEPEAAVGASVVAAVDSAKTEAKVSALESKIAKTA